MVRGHGAAARLFASAAGVALAAAVQAQPARQALAEEARLADQTTPDNVPADIVVTGSRIAATGFQAPTPVTVASAEELQLLAPRNLADALTQLPVFNNSLRTTQTTGGGLASGDAGQNLLNLRNLDANRVLVLLDGRRVVATNNRGAVDINILPQNLVSRVEVVTGGASAAYGSDAVAGVVNFILDTGFQGVRMSVQGGVSSLGDSPTTRLGLAAGRQFMGGRLRLVSAFEYARDGGVGILDRQPRDWHRVAAGQVQNPVAGARPNTLVVSDLKSAIGSYGGLISGGPLRGTQFVAGGVPAPFQYAAVVGSVYMGGGGGDPLAGDPGNGFSPDSWRATAFVHGELDLAPAVTLFADGLKAHSDVRIDGALNFGTGSASQLTIFRDNAFLPPQILARMVAANVQSFPLGRYHLEAGPVVNKTEVDVLRGSVGLKGRLVERLAWDASYAHSRTKQRLAKNNVLNLRNLFAASDAVRAPDGRIVCRSTLAGFDPGCAPLNPFGLNSVSPEAARFITGDSVSDLTLTQQVAAANLSGDLGEGVHLWAGPIGFAVGAEYRREEADQTSDALSQTVINRDGLRSGLAPASIQNRRGAFQFYNPQPFAGSFDVREAYAELGVPIAEGRPFAESLEASLAARYADYSQSGGVWTWKLGGQWAPVEAVRLRYTRSRDIRGPNVVELFNTQTQTTTNVVIGGQARQAIFIQSGNPALEPERALTETYGVVLRAPFAPGLQASVDRFIIDIDGAIATLQPQQIVDQCVAGNALACAQYTVSPTLVEGRVQPLNFATQRVAGVDMELAWTLPLGANTLGLRALVTHLEENFRVVPGGTAINSLGLASSPRWAGLFSASYQRGGFQTLVSGRLIGAATIDPDLTSDQLQGNDLPAVFYTNVALRYRFGEPRQPGFELFADVSNLFDVRPPVSPRRPSSYNGEPAALAYDWMGRFFTLGLRVDLR